MCIQERPPKNLRSGSIHDIEILLNIYTKYRRRVIVSVDCNVYKRIEAHSLWVRTQTQQVLAIYFTKGAPSSSSYN